MFPSIKIGPFVIGWYVMILSITLIVCTIFFLLRYNKNIGKLNISKFKVFLFPTIIIVIGAIGTRLLSVAEHLIISKETHSIDHIQKLILRTGGLDFYGAPLIIFLLLPILIKLYPFNQWLFLMDIAAPVWCLGYALARIGCLLSGDGCYGTWTNLPWGMYFPYGSQPNLLPVHPTPIYESIIHFILLFIVLKIDKNKRFLGQTFFFFVFFTSFFRFWIEFIRINPKMLWGLTLAQLISIFFMFSSAIIYYILKTKKETKNFPIPALQ